MQTAVDFALQECGRLDILVNNAISGVEEVQGNSWQVMEVAVGGHGIAPVQRYR